LVYYVPYYVVFWTPRGNRLICTRTCWLPVGSQHAREAEMAVASVSKITAASPTSFDAAIQEGLARASQTLRGITGLHVIEEKASVSNGKIAEYRVTMELTFILEG
jgi:dodecin